MSWSRSKILTLLGSSSLLLGTASPALLAQQGAQCPTPSTLIGELSGAMRHVRYLADDALEGREVASPGERCAAAYIEARFAEFGLEPGSSGDFEQSFRVRVGAQLGSHNLLSVAAKAYPIGEAWIPLGFAGTGMADGTLTLLDRGMVEDPHASAGAAPLEGKIVVVPIERANVDVHYTAAMAARRGAEGVVLVLPAERLPDISGERRPALSIPVAAVVGATGTELTQAAEQGAAAELMTQVEAAYGDGNNVVAVLPGLDGPDAPWVVVGAHYDHLGHGGEGSLAPDQYGLVHNGADDNASGAAALLEVAHRMAEASERPRLNVLFLAFSGEERGLWGSGFWVKNPTVPLDKINAMINMDMVGRLGTGSLTIFGVGTATEWPELLDRVNQHLSAPIPFSPSPDGYGPSDHSSFYGEGIPVLHFFTNTHEDYHRPSDDWIKIDGHGVDRVAEMVAAVASELAGTDGSPQALTVITGVGRPTTVTSDPTAPAEETASRGYGPYLGTIPDMTPYEAPGVRLTGVREDSPAQKAGLMKGDVIVEFGGHEVTDLYAYTYALQDFKPGDAVEIVVLRNGERVKLTAVLERR